MLKKDCDTSFYVLWSTLYAAQKRAQAQLEENRKKQTFVADIDIAQTDAIVSSLDKLAPPKRTLNRRDVLKLFAVPLHDPGEEQNAFLQLLTLMTSTRAPRAEDKKKLLEMIFRYRPLPPKTP
jgi:hypothetical protein